MLGAAGGRGTGRGGGKMRFSGLLCGNRTNDVLACYFSRMRVRGRRRGSEREGGKALGSSCSCSCSCSSSSERLCILFRAR
jgi:hypothetical protein